MLTYTGARDLFAELTNSDETAHLSFGDLMINEGIRMMMGETGWPFLEASSTISTVASQQFYELPANYDKLINVTVTVGSYKYRPEQVTSFNDWDFINSPTGVTSDVPSYYFITDGQIGFWPIPASNSNTITINFRKGVRDISLANYSTGTITAATNGSKTITGSGTSWTDGMKGMYLRITKGTAANLGDGVWYEVASVDSATQLTLADNYLGDSIAAGSASYILGDIMVIPELYQKAPVYFAVSEYWRKEGDAGRADRYLQMFDLSREQMLSDLGKKTTNAVVDDGEDILIVNPNLDPTVS